MPKIPGYNLQVEPAGRATGVSPFLSSSIADTGSIGQGIASAGAGLFNAAMGVQIHKDRVQAKLDIEEEKKVKAAINTKNLGDKSFLFKSWYESLETTKALIDSNVDAKTKSEGMVQHKKYMDELLATEGLNPDVVNEFIASTAGINYTNMSSFTEKVYEQTLTEGRFNAIETGRVTWSNGDRKGTDAVLTEGGLTPEEKKEAFRSYQLEDSKILAMNNPEEAIKKMKQESYLEVSKRTLPEMTSSDRDMVMQLAQDTIADNKDRQDFEIKESVIAATDTFVNRFTEQMSGTKPPITRPEIAEMARDIASPEKRLKFIEDSMSAVNSLKVSTVPVVDDPVTYGNLRAKLDSVRAGTTSKADYYSEILSNVANGNLTAASMTGLMKESDTEVDDFVRTTKTIFVRSVENDMVSGDQATITERIAAMEREGTSKGVIAAATIKYKVEVHRFNKYLAIMDKEIPKIENPTYEDIERVSRNAKLILAKTPWEDSYNEYESGRPGSDYNSAELDSYCRSISPKVGGINLYDIKDKNGNYAYRGLVVKTVQENPKEKPDQHASIILQKIRK